MLCSLDSVPSLKSSGDISAVAVPTRAVAGQPRPQQTPVGYKKLLNGAGLITTMNALKICCVRIHFRLR